MKNKPSRKVIIANLTLLALAILFGLSIFFAAHFYAVPLLTFIGSWAIAHFGITGASIIAGAVGVGSLLAISAESLQRGSVANFYKVLAGAVLNLVTLFAFRKQIQAKLGLDTYYRKDVVIGAGSRKNQILHNTTELKKNTQNILSHVQALSQRLPTTSLEHTAHILPTIYAEQPASTATSSTSTTSSAIPVSSEAYKSVFTTVETDKNGKGKEPLISTVTSTVPTSTQSQSANVR